MKRLSRLLPSTIILPYLVLLGTAMLILGAIVIAGESLGYEVVYEDQPVGFVSRPAEVLDNLDPLCIALTEDLQMQAAVTGEDFNFEKKYRIFQKKDQWREVAGRIADSGRPEVNLYELKADGRTVARTNYIEQTTEALGQVLEDYRTENPEADYDRIGFTENLVWVVSRGQPLEEEPTEEITTALKSELTVETVTDQYEQEIIPYETVYEETESRPLGEQSVKVNGVEGARITHRVIVCQNGQEVSRNESETVLTQPVDQVILVGTYAEEIPWEGQEFLQPVNGTLSSKMGWRWGRIHKGIDISAPTGEPILASKGGVVTVAGYNDGGYGNMVRIDHGDGSETLYAHMSAVLVEPGEEVLAGQIIGLVGSTGRSTGPHLHFEIILDGAIADPLDYVSY